MAWIVANYDPEKGCEIPPTAPGRAPGRCRVLKTDRDGRAVLDEGTVIDVDSLALKGRIVTWMTNGEQRSPSLRQARRR